MPMAPALPPRRSAVLLVAALTVPWAGCPRRDTAPTTVVHEVARYVKFAGRDWVVRPSGRREAPGPNHWSDSDESVWVDDQGFLHLKVRKARGRWLAAEIHTPLPAEPFHLEVTTATPMRELDPNVVAGFFAYKDDSNEIDIELSEWGARGGFNTQFAVAPYGEGDRHRFTAPSDVLEVVHVMDWRADRVALASRVGDRTLAEWRRAGPRFADRSGYRLHINLWLYQGKPPTDREEVELVVRYLTLR